MTTHKSEHPLTDSRAPERKPTTVHLTKVDLTRCGTRGWAPSPNPLLLHKLVMGLFPDHVAPTPRAAADILFRYEAGVPGPDQEGPHLFVQSRIAPSHLPEGAHTLQSTIPTWEVGAVLRVRLAMTPSYRIGKAERTALAFALPGEGDGSRVTFNDLLARRTGHFMDVRAVLDYRRAHYPSAPRDYPMPIDTIDAIVTVTEAQAFHEAQVRGIGRQRSYGSGLLSAIPASGTPQLKPEASSRVPR